MYKVIDFAYDMQQFNEIINIDKTGLSAMVFLSENLQFVEKLNDVLNICGLSEEIIKFKDMIEPFLVAFKLSNKV
jgi:hypothetical protein